MYRRKFGLDAQGVTVGVDCTFLPSTRLQYNPKIYVRVEGLRIQQDCLFVCSGGRIPSLQVCLGQAETELESPLLRIEFDRVFH